MRTAILALALIAGQASAQNMSQMGNAPRSSTISEREAAIAKCFADAPDGSRHDAWLEHCLKDAR